MQLPEISVTAAANVVRLADGARRTRVLYAGDIELAKPQFASVAPQLQLIPVQSLLGAGDDIAVPADSIDAVLIDCAAANVDAAAVADQLRAHHLDAPIVLALDPVVADQSPSRIATELRVDDYTVKLPGWLVRLPSRLEMAITHHRRRRTLETMQASTDRLRSIVESAPVCLVRVAGDSTILAMNTAALTMVGIDAPEDVLGKSLASFAPEESAGALRQFIETVSAGRPGSLEVELVNVAGNVRVVDARAVPLAADALGRSSALLVLRDATERKRLEASMLEHAAASHVPAAAHVEAEERDQLRRLLDAALEECRRIEAERDAQRRTAEDAETERASVSARCDSLEGLVETLQARHAAEALELKAARAEAEAQLREVEDADRPLLAEVDALQASLSVLRAQYDELNSAAQTNEARHSARVEEIEARLHDAVAERETFRHRLDEREAECARLTEENAALQAASATQLDDAQSAFNEAFKLVSQPQEAAIERSAYEAIEQRLQDAEAECQRLAAQREERDSMVRALESEVEQLLELRRLQRQELVRALQESDESEQLASTRLAQCVRLRQMLNEAQASLQRLSEWAAHQSTRLSAPIDASGERLLPDVDAPTPRVVRRSNGAAASMEASWS